jgi:hypothetical protein
MEANVKIDFYTKVVLSVIAACLVWQCVNGVTPAVAAQAAQAAPVRPTPVIIVDERGTPLVTAQGLRVNLGGQPLPVVLNNETVPVSVTAIERRGIWQSLPVEVQKSPSTPFPTP